MRERRGCAASRVGLHAGGLDLDPGALQIGLEPGRVTPLHGGACLRTERGALACDTRKTVGCDRLRIGEGDIPPQFERRERERRCRGLLIRSRSAHTRATPTAEGQRLRQRHRGLRCIEVPVWPTAEDILDLDRQRRVLPSACLPRAGRRPFALRRGDQGCRTLRRSPRQRLLQREHRRLARRHGGHDRHGTQHEDPHRGAPAISDDRGHVLPGSSCRGTSARCGPSRMSSAPAPAHGWAPRRGTTAPNRLSAPGARSGCRTSTR